ncbi:MAG: LuxR family transcriptional regulator [Gammaproteobacteria bacterium]
MKNLGHCIELISLSRTPEQAFDRFGAAMHQHGYDRIAYSLVTDHPSLGLPRQYGLASSYPEDWMKHYRERNYMEIDPVMRRVMRSRKPFHWSELTADPKLPAPALQLMKEAEESGLRDGIGIPLCSPAGEIVGIGLARSDPGAGVDYAFLAAACLLSVYFDETFRDLLATPLGPNLTDRQREVLYWAAEGKTDQEVALILTVSAHTVRFHWKNIFEKLDAKGRTYAVTKAIRLHLIVPGIVRLSPSHR